MVRSLISLSLSSNVPFPVRSFSTLYLKCIPPQYSVSQWHSRSFFSALFFFLAPLNIPNIYGTNVWRPQSLWDLCDSLRSEAAVSIHLSCSKGMCVSQDQNWTWILISKYGLSQSPALGNWVKDQSQPHGPWSPISGFFLSFLWWSLLSRTLTSDALGSTNISLVSTSLDVTEEGLWH